MPDKRLNELREHLKSRDWKVVGETAGEDGRPAIWQIKRKPDHGPFHLEFESFDKGEPAQIEQGFAVRIRELKQTSIYLYRKRNEDAWARVVSELLSALDELDS
ncbi:MAG: hypothetical protein K8I27_02830 [Planctomycetes bacterium]|nr:hypothetical protein [Planctomycetota bacterium]